MLDRIEMELRQEAVKLLAAADALYEVRTGKKKQPRKQRRKQPIEVAREAAARHGIDPDAVQPAPGGGMTLDLGTATGLEEKDVRESDLVHTTSEGNGRRRIA